MKRRWHGERGALSVASDGLFLGYVGALIGAGAWGALFPRTDARLIEGWDPRDDLPPQVAATRLSQHRFLRAMELAFGLFALRSRAQIVTDRAWNGLFLSAMGTGIAVRGVGLVVDGKPGPLPYAFAGYELVAIGVIFAHTRTTLAR
jgi:hypothetical protein